MAFYFVCRVIFYAVPIRLQCCKENKVNVWVDFDRLCCARTLVRGRWPQNSDIFCPVLPQLCDYLLGSLESGCCHSRSWQRVKLGSSVLENLCSCHHVCCPPLLRWSSVDTWLALWLLVQRRMRPAWTGSQWTWSAMSLIYSYVSSLKVQLLLSLRNLWQITEYCLFLRFWHLALCTWGDFCL